MDRCRCGCRGWRRCRGRCGSRRGCRDVGLVGRPPVGCDRSLSRCQGDGVIADQSVELVLDAVLGSGTFGAVVGLGPQVGLSVGSAPDLQGDEVVLLVVPGGGITLVGVAGGELFFLSSVVTEESGRMVAVHPDTQIV